MSAERRLYCGILFWIKCLLSLALSIGLFVFFGLQIANKRTEALKGSALSNKTEVVKIPIEPGSLSCSTNSSTTRLMLNGNNKMYMGFSLDFQPGNLPVDIAKTLNGRLPNLFNAFYKYPSTWDKNMLNWHASLLNGLGHGPILQLSLDPDNYDVMTDAGYADIATECARINSDFGVPILLRWGHEMNGMINRILRILLNFNR